MFVQVDEYLGCSFRKKNSRLVRYLGDLVLHHDLGTLEIFFVFVQAEE